MHQPGRNLYLNCRPIGKGTLESGPDRVSSFEKQLVWEVVEPDIGCIRCGSGTRIVLVVGRNHVAYNQLSLCCTPPGHA